jgi:hypothetical protein
MSANERQVLVGPKSRAVPIGAGRFFVVRGDLKGASAEQREEKQPWMAASATGGGLERADTMSANERQVLVGPKNR